jgi:hypothetical protein
LISDGVRYIKLDCGCISLKCRRQPSITIFASTRFRSHSKLRRSPRSLSLNDSSAPFCHGLAGSIKAVSMIDVADSIRSG